MRQCYSARSPCDISKLATLPGTPFGPSRLADLTPTELRRSASTWGPRHLVPYRLLVQPVTSYLKAFEVDHRQSCPVCSPKNASAQILDHDMVKNLLRDVDIHSTKRDLLREPGGFFWVSLALACHPDRKNETKTYPERERRPMTNSHYADSSVAIPGSSSPTQPSSSEYEDAASRDIDEDEYEERRRIPEDIAARLGTDFASFALQLCLIQGDRSVEICPRVDHRRTKTTIANVDNIICEDDGGLCEFEKTPHGWVAAHPFIALFEAKRAFGQLWVDPKTGESSPITSDQTLAQYLAEAVITRRGNRKFFKREWVPLHNEKAKSSAIMLSSVFIVALSSTFGRICHFHFGDYYDEYLDASAADQGHLINDNTKDTCVHLQCTKWFNLQTSDGRKIGLCHILALLRWYHTQDHEGSAGASSDTNMSSSSSSGSDMDYG
ncbi:uncharacterized protein F5Z01DRAFT_629038 [Emericellopsis atlantica]|uniref:Uncharacterized protein n=1 Tax=Emericellopsis atlantica TaxID=2614577 RepID=A0A9P8CL31_9HYPO|nr:uncharacterized protein F5Z01DRAFT_629038 [Emericellopsis atlantica]KAG9250662.1 hypothetical protein F5Z01DRAFT_629038 [Emericellopsis atlantica]